MMINHILAMLACSSFDQATTKVVNEVTYVKPLYMDCHSHYPIALAAMNYTCGHLSAPNYGYYNEYGHCAPKTTGAALELEAGLCGNAQDCFVSICERLQLKVRRLYIWYPQHDRGSLRAGHCVAEVYWNESWHFFDPTYGTFFRGSSDRDDILSLIEVLELPKERREVAQVTDQTLLWQDACHHVGLRYLDYDKLIIQEGSYSGPIIYQRG